MPDMAIMLTALVSYAAIAAYVYWFLIGTSGVGIRMTRGDVLSNARREGPRLIILALAWFPLLLVLLVRALLGAWRPIKEKP